MKILSEEKINTEDKMFCYFCNKPILLGENIRESENELTINGENIGHVAVHSSCAAKDEKDDEFSAPNGICPVCFMELPNSGVCCESE